ncbi:MAG: VTT domain-containing protein [Nitrospirota bacterium]
MTPVLPFESTMTPVLPFLTEHGYALLFFWVLLETVGLPIPSVPLLITVGALAGVGQMNLKLCIGLGVCAALLSDIFWYSIGWYRGRKALSLLCRISLEPDSCVRRTENIFARYGTRSLLIVKFIPGLSAVSTPLAGIIHMSFPRFLLFDGMGIFIWVGSYTILGYIVSTELDRVLEYASGMGTTLLVLIAGGLTIYILWKYASRRRFFRELRIARITPEELKRKLDAGERVLIIDVRHSVDFDADPYIIPGAHRIPFEQAGNRVNVADDRDVVVYCT